MSPHEVTALQVLAHVLLQNSQAGKAAVLLEALDALRPADARTLLALATAHLRNASAPRAWQVLERVLQQAPGEPAVHLLRAQALSAMDRPDEALEAMKRFIALRRKATPDSSHTE